MSDRAQSRLRRRAGRMRLTQRLDVSMALLWGGTLILLGLLVLALLVVAELGQWFALPGTRPLADERILENLRTSSGASFVDGVWQSSEERLYVGQSDWTLHRYDPDTRLWSTERPLGAPLAGGDEGDDDPRRPSASAGAVDSALALLDGGCGSLGSGLTSLLAGLGLDGQGALNPGAALLAAGGENCPDPSALYALSQEGGLLRRRPAGFPSGLRTSPWQVLMGDNAFIGASGAPVEQDSLTTAAVSPDRELLALGSSDGLGLFHTSSRRWLDNSAVHRGLQERHITHLAFWRGLLWIGNEEGLTPLDLDSDQPVPLTGKGLPGRVIDLDAEPSARPEEGALWVLQERRCLSGRPQQQPDAPPENGTAGTVPGEEGAAGGAAPSGNSPPFPHQPSGGCLRLVRLDSPDQQPVLLIDEESRFPSLNLDDLHFAQQRGDLLVVAGRAGIYAYDLSRRSWAGLFPRPVTSVLPMPGGSGFYFGYAGGMGVESGGDVSTWPLSPDDVVVALRFGRGAEVLGLAGNGSLYAFDGVDAPVALRQSTRSALAEGSPAPGSPATESALPFDDAVGLLDAVFLAGDSGALLHNAVTRQYVDIAADQIPAWMRAPGRRFFASDRYLYVLSPQQAGRSAAYILPRYRIEEGDLDSHLQPVLLRSPVGPVRDWDGRGVGLIDASGNALRLHPGGQQRFNGLPQPGLDGLPLLDAAAHQGRLTLVTSAGLQTYDTGTRSWSGFIPAPLESPARQAVYYNDQLLVLHQDGRLGRTTSTAHVIGDRRGFSMSDQQLSDVYQRGRLLYLAGAGAVEAYDPLLRRIIARWRPGGGGDVEVLGISGNRPVSLTRGGPYLGNDPIDTGGGRVLAASLEERRLWMLMEQGGTRFVRSQAAAAPSSSGSAPSCYFRRPSAGPQVRELLDAARLPNGTLAVATDAGLRFYDPAIRSWTDPPAALRDFPARRVRSVGRQILAWTGEDDPDNGPTAPPAGRSDGQRTGSGSGGTSARSSTSGSGTSPIRLAVVSQGALQWPDSCSPEAAALRPNASIQWREALDLTLSPDGNRAAWLLPDQAVEQLSGGQVRRLLDGKPTASRRPGADAEVPPWDELQALYDRTQAPLPYLLAAEGAPDDSGRQEGDVRLWSYRLDRRSWRPVDLSGLGGDSAQHLNLMRDAATEIVTVRAHSGSIYRGAFQPLSPPSVDSATSLAAPLSLLYAPSPPLPQAAPPLDVQGSGNLWTFVLPRGVFHYNALRRRWLPTALGLRAADPTLQLRRAGGRLIAVAESGNTWYVADDESDTPLSWTRRQGPGTSAGMETPPALATGWLRWDRPGNRFMLTTPDGVQELAASQSLDAPGQRYFFEEVEAVMAPNSQVLYAANDSGLWMHPQPQLGLGDAGVTYQPAALGQPISAQGSRLAGSSLTFEASDGQLRSSATADGGSGSTGQQEDGVAGGPSIAFGGTSRRIGLGTLVLSSRAAGSGLNLSSGQGPSGSLQRGFPWDARRRQVAYDGSGNLILITGNGPHPALGFGAVGRPPARPSDPVRVSDDTWTWRRGSGPALEVRRADGASVQHGSASHGSGYSFTPDRLRDAAFHRGTLWLLSEAGLHKSDGPATGLRWQNVEASSLTGVDSLDRERTPQGAALLVRSGHTIVQRRDNQWQSPSSALVTGLMADSARLRFQRSGPLAKTGAASRAAATEPRIVKLLRIESSSGVSQWVPFRWQGGRFPFDIVTSMATHGRRLLLGTQAGLQVYSGYADGGLDAIDHIYALGTAPSEGHQVERVGVPPGQPETAVASGEGLCLSLALEGNPRPCSQPPPPTSLRADTPLWRWTASGRRVEGRYKLSEAGSDPPGTPGPSAGSRVTIRAGRLPHDRLTDLASFESGSFFLWDDGRVSFHPRGSGRLRDMRIYGGFSSPPRGFAALSEQSAEDPPPVSPGLYLRLTDGNALHWQSASRSWRALEPVQAGQLSRHLDALPVFRQGRLRLAGTGSASSPFRFQHRTPQGSWQPLSWRRGRLEIDIWNDFVPYGGQIWAATPAGLAAFRRGPEQVRLDTSSFRLIQGPRNAQGDLLAVTDMQSDGAALVLRCNADSRQLFKADLEQLDDARVFTPAQGDDPFARQTLVQTDYWQWRREGRSRGSPGILRFTLKDRESALEAGRFAFDSLTSLAFFAQGLIETATPSAGWLRYPVNDDGAAQFAGAFHPANLVRPQETAFDPAGIQRLHLGRALNQPALCLSDAQGRAWRLLPEADPAQVSSCPAHLAQDSLWAYTFSPSGLRAESNAIPFPARRRLSGGRFQDAVALTPPRVLAAQDRPATASFSPLELPAGSRYLVLTPSGIVVLDAQFESVQLITPDWTHYESLREALSRTRLPQPPLIPGLPPDFNLMRTVATPSGTYILGQSELLEMPSGSR